MAHDEQLAERIRALLAEEPEVTEQRMFGGLAFLVDGHLAVAASGRGGLLARVDPAEGGRLVATTRAREMEMRGRSMPGWLRVPAEDVRTTRELERWVRRSVSHARSLPPKRG